MKNIFIIVCIAILSFNCKNKSANKHSSENSAEQSIEKSATTLLELGCYVYNDGKNKINFEITQTGNHIKGNLNYELYEKDANTGVFKGRLTNDTLLGIYTFNSEGVESSREVAFKVQNKALIEGYGELNEAGNAFKNKKAIHYNSKMPLKETDCNL